MKHSQGCLVGLFLGIFVSNRKNTGTCFVLGNSLAGDCSFQARAPKAHIPFSSFVLCCPIFSSPFSPFQ
ncbi:MAG: hypothetical protein COV66_05440 [Nitrospinae bacterium CG11_big_fil_rev_8_21_14_0_20_45_15]|nr:MAG: hypothetical protein COV66_05440 [Nitrospinae bacterium CG11_big_fil_rev_8_21_14_0_20_45_15]